ncbi:MAG: hypothetical protein ABJC13_16975 [Acidobacteriota bacterium]
MTKLLEQVVAQASALPEAERESLAGRWLAELVDEQGWQERFASSQDVLASLAEEALAEHQAGLTEKLDLDRL